MVLPTECPRSEGLLAGICRTKVKVPAIPLGLWVVVTNDKCIRTVCPAIKFLSFEPRHEKTGFLHMRKQRRRSASR